MGDSVTRDNSEPKGTEKSLVWQEDRVAGGPEGRPEVQVEHGSRRVFETR